MLYRSCWHEIYGSQFWRTFKFSLLFCIYPALPSLVSHETFVQNDILKPNLMDLLLFFSSKLGCKTEVNLTDCLGLLSLLTHSVVRMPECEVLCAEAALTSTSDRSATGRLLADHWLRRVGSFHSTLVLEDTFRQF